MIGRDEGDFVRQVGRAQVGAQDRRQRGRFGESACDGTSIVTDRLIPVNALMAWTLTRSRRGRYTGRSVHRPPDRSNCPNRERHPCHRGHPRQGRRRAHRRDCRVGATVRRRSAGRRRPLARSDARHRRSSTARASFRTTAAAKARRCGSSFDAATTGIVVFIDADGSHDPKDIPALVAPIKAGQADMVIGSRGKGGSDELHGTLEQFIRYVGSQLIMLAINYRWNVRLTDSQNGFRAIRRDVGRQPRSDVQPDDDRAGNADEGAQAGLPRQRDRQPRIRAPMGHVEGRGLEAVVRLRLVVPPQPDLTEGYDLSRRSALLGSLPHHCRRRGVPLLRSGLGRAVLPLPHRRAHRLHLRRIARARHQGSRGVGEVLHVLAGADVHPEPVDRGVQRARRTGWISPFPATKSPTWCWDGRFPPRWAPRPSLSCTTSRATSSGRLAGVFAAFLLAFSRHPPARVALLQPRRQHDVLHGRRLVLSRAHRRARRCRGRRGAALGLGLASLSKYSAAFLGPIIGIAELLSPRPASA